MIYVNHDWILVDSIAVRVQLRGNAFIQAEPTDLHFTGTDLCRLGKFTSKRTLKLINVAREATRVNIIPPETQFFTLTYHVPTCFVPGSRIVCCVKFKPLENRYYEDVIRIHTKDIDKHIIIPLYGYPAVGRVEFPRQINLSSVPMGQTKTYITSIKSESVVDFGFVLRAMNDNSNFQVYPMEGNLRAKGVQKIRIQFTPTDYTTQKLTLRLNVAQLNFEPKLCEVIGRCEPGLESKRLKETFASQEGIPETVDPAILHIRPLDRVRAIRQQKQQQKNQNEVERTTTAKTTVNTTGASEEMHKKPCVHRVAQVLIGSKKFHAGGVPSPSQRRQEQLLTFDASVRQNAVEEQRNQVRWQAKLGEQPLSENERSQMQYAWIQSWQAYLSKCTDPESRECQPANLCGIDIMRAGIVPDSAEERTGRPHRSVEQKEHLESIRPTFRIERLPKAAWTKRTQVVDRFRSIVSRVMLRQRMMWRLKKFRRVLDVNFREKLESDERDQVILPDDIADKIGRLHSSEWLPTDSFGVTMSEDWIDRSLNVTSNSSNKSNEDANEGSGTAEMDYWSAMDTAQLTSAFVTTAPAWPLFDLQPDVASWQPGCEWFDPSEARELAYWTVDTEELQTGAVVKLLEPNLVTVYNQDYEQKKSEEPLVCIESTDSNYSPGDPLSMPAGCLTVPKACQQTIENFNCRNLDLVWTPDINFRPVVMSYLDEQFNPVLVSRERSIQTQQFLNEPLHELEARDRTINQCQVAQVLKQATTSATDHKELVPVCARADLKLRGAESQQEYHDLRAKIAATEDLLSENALITPSVPSKMREWMGRYRELVDPLKPYMDSENTPVEKRSLDMTSVLEIDPQLPGNLDEVGEQAADTVMDYASGLESNILSCCERISFDDSM